MPTSGQMPFRASGIQLELAADQPELIRVDEAAAILSVSHGTVRRWCDVGLLKCMRITSRGDRRLVRAEVEGLAKKLHENNGYTRNRHHA